MTPANARRRSRSRTLLAKLSGSAGLLLGLSAVAVALRLCAVLRNAVIVTIVCDRGDRYLSTGVFPD
jgi:cysteine synthase B